ncbi:MAG: pas57 [Actinomycetia bacterium]|nr:pas57 [Actinomycetes bacterium]
MKKLLAVSAAVAATAAVLAVPATANATSVPGQPTCNTSWYQNPDETNRKPVQNPDGMEFSGSDLVHHRADTTVEALTHGTYSASPAPDQPSFFSVEVSGTDGGYATLRWDTGANKWTMVTGGQLYSDTSPATLVDQVTPHKSHHVVSFGVGYTANPPGTVTTLVHSVKFNGHDYSLACHTKPTPTPTTGSPSPSPTGTTPSPAPSSTTPGEAPAPSPVTGDLPVTG